jgi:hypothetical protein
MDLFSQLDRSNSAVSQEIAMIVRYRTRFHRDIMFSSVSTNPAKSLEQIASAVAINQPSEFLPQPWPPMSLRDEESLRAVSLIKMKAIVKVGLRLPEVHSALLSKLISHRFPKRSSLDAAEDTTTSCEICIDDTGSVTYTFDGPKNSAIVDSSLLVQPNGRHDYVKAMMILSLENDLEHLHEE